MSDTSGTSWFPPLGTGVLVAGGVGLGVLVAFGPTAGVLVAVGLGLGVLVAVGVGVTTANGRPFETLSAACPYCAVTVTVPAVRRSLAGIATESVVLFSTVGDRPAAA
ncbi:MAG: hypothetical protein KatS3mg060_1921 [Dehalococcoidia bacterium]|nr:MAG: hypothetical protein KatS3mg060_1921 [Dehalococcoidia bacterium]